MKIEFDNEKDKELFVIMLDNFRDIAIPEPDEVEFLNKVYECVRLDD